jgi:transmembrane sensor
MKIENNYEILFRYISGQCSQQEIEEVERWISDSDENKKSFELLKKVWLKESMDLIYQNPEDAWVKFSKKTGLFSTTDSGKKHERMYYGGIIKYAAAILVVLLPLLYFSGLFGGGEYQIHMQEYFVKNGSRKTITLADGSKIMLDAGSTLKYPAEFVGNERRVYLHGEGYFEVASDSTHPFIVEAGQAEIKVLGTKFDVRNWDENQKVILTVSEGKVRFKNNLNETSSVILTRDEQSNIYGSNPPTAPEKVDTKKNLAWMHNEIYFENVPLRDIISQLERWYDVTVILENESANSELLTINIRNKSYKENFDFLALVAGYNVSYKGKIITLY